MTDEPVARISMLRDLDEAGWTLVADRVIRGICHEINGRVNTLTSLSYLMDSGSGEWGRVGSTVEDELLGLEGLSRLLRLLTDDRRESELVDPREMLSLASRYVRLQTGHEGTKFDLRLPPDTPAVRVDPTLAGRCLLLLLAGAAEAARARGSESVRILGDAEGGAVSISPAREGSTVKGSSYANVPPHEIPEAMEALVAGVWKEMGGELVKSEVGEGGVSLELVWPKRRE